ncbi:2-oxoglutarate dehydrogenase complex dihydrolipoyllysine-residue succinyltransferase [Phototrophicus methaneseepsis]|uniref:Dihydrolipoyllysine-residue succinyltransferase component of 2-oxoglutarate dehydrogenase complex n=1 Tax=Phototrophicus methaneseepsis TaxID=2710758 RepID=A0A7S8E6S9_9CHLR|nr:2-oxoglutarate dehydrogenase complex dihydrolipoyllysine-residue succinyltransferase [Phototrophicus methaneseepsis]QPC81379.1 2-oxoglutarate dehydrogenase complex dihydrolipoyllysine-residue succinyltransferase [Phototrophicus methaneseepsis]
MATVEVKVPELSESVVEATVGEWLVGEGDAVEAGQVLVVLETDKVNLEVVADGSGTLKEIRAQEGDDVGAHAVLGVIDGEGIAADAPAEEAPASEATSQPEAAPVPSEPASATPQKATPVAERAAAAHNVNLSDVSPSNGKRVTKQDVLSAVSKPSETGTRAPAPTPASAGAAGTQPTIVIGDRHEREVREKLSRRRRTIARNLVNAQQTAAMLTTFNEIDMGAVMDLRKKRKEAFKEKFGVGLGLNSFFVKAVVGALKAFPLLNAEIDGDEVIRKNYYDIGIAVGSEEGLVVPVIRDADRLGFAAIEDQVRGFVQQIQEKSLPIDALLGGTFTITNGGIFGSMMSTPILNYPQVGILGLHGIKDRPVVIDGEIVIRPMMYVALTYDHRIVDGREAVQFLVKIKELIEDPEALLLEG